jgi:hypothetical protein
MSHTLLVSGSTITIHVDQDGWSNSQEAILAKHQILDTDHTTFQFMGAKSPQLDLGFKLYGLEYKLFLEEHQADGDEVVYTDDLSVSGSYVMEGLSMKRIQALNYSDAWYDCRAQMHLIAASGSTYYQQ